MLVDVVGSATFLDRVNSVEVAFFFRREETVAVEPVEINSEPTNGSLGNFSLVQALIGFGAF